METMNLLTGSDPKSSPVTFEIRPLSSWDLAAVATLHTRAFPAAAISQLGRDAAHRYYRSVLNGAHQAIGLGAFERGRLFGFCFGGVWNDPEKYFLKSNLLFIAGRVLSRPWLLKTPFFRDRICCGLRMLWPRRAPRTRQPPSPTREKTAMRSLGILYLAVDPAARKRGIARRLMEQIEGSARRQGFQQLDLSVYLDNHAAINLYERMGWQRSPRDGTWKGFMTKSLA